MLNRREFLAATTAASAASAATTQPVPKGKADACIFMWLGGGAAHMDTWDPKIRGDGKKKAGSYYKAIDTAIKGEQVCEHLSRSAPLLDRAAIVRSITHDISGEHAAAANLVHTGRKPSGTILYPAIGAIVSHQLGPKSEELPAYVVMGYPSIIRDPGFLGAKHGYVYLTQIETGPNGLVRPPDVDLNRQDRRETLLGGMRDGFLKRNASDQTVQQQDAITKSAYKLAGPKFLNVFDLARENATLRESYGGEFGQRCLLARRLVQSGVRFVEVSHNLNFLNGSGWDTHNEGQLNQHLLIQELDKAFATLIADLEQNKMLDRTLVVVATEFGRPPEFDSGGGRGHQSLGFSMVLAGGGLKTGQVIGRTDEIGKQVVDRPISVPDFHATIHCALGIDPHKNLYSGDRPVPITDRGTPIADLFS